MIKNIVKESNKNEKLTELKTPIPKINNNNKDNKQELNHIKN